MADDADVLVIGAGPAGAAAAMVLARGGARVVVLEAARFPRDKTCGDGLGLDCHAELERHGLLERVRAAAGTTFHGVALSGPSGVRVELTTVDRRLPGFAGNTFAVPRMVLDELLARAARDAGAEIRESTRVTGTVRRDDGRVAGVRTAAGEVVRAAVVLACGGEHDPVAREVGRPADPRRRAFAVRVYYDDLPEPMPLAEVSFAAHVLPGYGWVFPTGPRTANVGVGLRADLLKRRGGELRGMLETFVGETPVGRRWLAGARRVTAVRGWPLTFGSQAGRTAGDGWLLCGDAARLIDPLTGEGIGNALLSGRLAAETVLAGDLSALGLAAYERAWRSRLQAGFRAGHLLQEAFTRPWVVERVVRQAARRRRLGTEVAAMIGGAWPKTRAFLPMNLFQVAF